MKEQLFKYIDEHQEELISLVQNIVQIPSVKSSPSKSAPFGKSIAHCLSTVLSYAENMGFHTVNLDNYIGYAEYGDGEEYIAIVGHLDVVPEGDSWIHPPFGAEIHDGILYGRGVLDNKAPILSCLFALKCLKDNAYTFPYRVRIIFGTDEESGFNDIPYYLEREPIPLMGFTPDCKFPVIYGENGSLRLQITQKCQKSTLLLQSILGDFRPSVVPAFCQMNFKIPITNAEIYLKELKNTPLQYFLDGDILSVSYTGKQAPSNNPYLGDNAIIGLITYLPSILSKGMEEFVQLFRERYVDIYGAQLGIDFSDDKTGKLMISVYEIIFTNDEIAINLSLRYPLNCPSEPIFQAINKYFPTYKIHRHFPAVYFPLDHPMVKTLSEVYHEITGLDAEPLTTTGGTYAKVMPNILAFGPSFPGERGIAHNPDEYMSISHIVTMAKIYSYSIFKLANLKL